MQLFDVQSELPLQALPFAPPALQCPPMQLFDEQSLLLLQAWPLASSPLQVPP